MQPLWGIVRIFWTVMLLVFSVACSKNHGGDAPAAPVVENAEERPQLQRDEPLPELARDLLRMHMIEHGDSMESLLWSALMLDHETTQTVTEHLLGQPRMSRPSAAAGETLNDWLPPRFFDLQDQMYDAAKALQQAARAKDDQGTARAYAKLAETCVTCHSLYLSIPSDSVKAERGD